MDYQDTPTAGFVEYMKDVENDKLRDKFKLDPSYITTPHDSPEGGTKTTGYGHKLAPGEAEFGMNEQQTNERLEKDLTTALHKSGAYVDATFGGGAWDGLPPSKKEALADYQYNLKGGVAKFPKLTEAIIKDNQPEMVRQFRRNYTDKDGVKKDMDTRNQKWWTKYGRPMTGVKYQQTASVSRTFDHLEEQGVYFGDLNLRGDSK